MAERSAATEHAPRKDLVAMLDSLSVEELAAVIEAATTRHRAKQEEAKAAMLAKWKAEAAAAGLSFETLLPGLAGPGKAKKARKDQGGSVAVKYRGPNGEEWSGRGRMPRWMQALEAEGKGRDEFKVTP